MCFVFQTCLMRYWMHKHIKYASNIIAILMCYFKTNFVLVKLATINSREKEGENTSRWVNESLRAAASMYEDEAMTMPRTECLTPNNPIKNETQQVAINREMLEWKRF